MYIDVNSYYLSDGIKAVDLIYMKKIERCSIQDDFFNKYELNDLEHELKKEEIKQYKPTLRRFTNIFD